MSQELKALNLSDEDLDRLSLVTEQDIIVANTDIVSALDKKFKNLPLSEDSELVALEEENE